MHYDVQPTDDLFARLGSLQAGDTVTVHAGTYTPGGTGFVEVTWPGTAANPIAVMAAPGEHVVIQGVPSQNVLNLIGSYFTLDGIELRGGSHGIRLKSVDHATLSNLVLHDLGDVGISCNFEPDICDQVTLIHNEIYDTGHAGTGEGMYLGCNDDLCRITNSTIANNFIHDLGGSQGDGIEVKTGSYGNTVIDNVIVRAKYPGITMYGFAGSHPANLVTRNLVWHTLVDNGIQVAGQVVVANNVVIDSAGNGIQSKPSQAQTPHDVTIVHNTVIGAGTGSACLKTNNWSTETNQLVANNALYCQGGTAFDLNGGGGTDIVIVKNLGLGTSTAPAGFALGASLVDFVDAPAGNVYPATGSPLVDAGDPAQAMTTEDFNGTPRADGHPDIGAYERTAATNPGWVVMEGFKTLPAGNDGPAVTGDDTGTTGGGGGGCCNTTSHPTSAGWLATFVMLMLLRRRRVTSSS